MGREMSVKDEMQKKLEAAEIVKGKQRRDDCSAVQRSEVSM